jgi:myosin heavy subunit
LKFSLTILAFGNAKTTRNNNSSRFGKFIELNFNQAGFLSGASIVSYLLEKSRVIRQGEKERGFHIFYQLIAGATPDQKNNLALKDPSTYQYLNKSGCTTVHNMDDAAEFKDLLKALEIMAFSKDEVDAVLAMIAGTFKKCRNLTFRYFATR